MNENGANMKTKVLSGLFWKFSERVGARLIGFLVSLLLARLLSPTDYGVVALLNIFITLADIFVTSGLGNSLVQKQEADDLDFSSVFYCSMALVAILYLAIFFSAPMIARFYGNDLLAPLLQVMAVRLIFTGVGTVQNAYVDRNMLFKKYFLSTISGTVLSGIVAFAMAFAGFGAWALAAQYIVQGFIGTVVLWFTVKWRPKLMFSVGRMKSLYSFGWRLLATRLIDTVYKELRGLIIGRLYSPAHLGYYTRGMSFPSLIDDNLTNAINSVLFSALSREQKNSERVRAMTCRSIKTTAYLVMPIMTGLAVCADPLVRFLLTDKWIECVPYLQIACFSSALLPIQEANLQAIKALGRSDTLLKLSIIKRSVSILLLLLVMWHGVIAIAWSLAASSVIFLIINIYPNVKMLNYSFKDQILDIIPFIGMCALLAVAAYPILFLGTPPVVTLILQALAGCAVYLLCSVIFKIDSFYYILEIVKSRIKGSANIGGF